MSTHATNAVPRLSWSALNQVVDAVDTPNYIRSNGHRIGILHFGPGAFHRAHQAAYIDQVLRAGHSGWGICGVSLRSTDVRDKLAEQDFLYSLAIQDVQPECRIIGSVFEVLAAQDQSLEILAKFEKPTIRVVSLTITEKGYCLTPGGDLDESHPDIAHDIANPQAPRSAIGYLVEGYRRRRAAGLPPFTSLSCDNLVGNGDRLSRAVVQFAEHLDKELASWIRDTAGFPNTMVDSITPATDDNLRLQVLSQTGVSDEVPVQREAFAQWVIEDSFSDGRPPLEEVGVTFTSDVAPYEQAKLRILNGLHSSLAYTGILNGHTTVFEAMADKDIRKYLRQMVDTEILGSLDLQDLNEYVDSIFTRFENPSIEYSLRQIAGDSSQKLPFRIMGTIRDNLIAGRPVDHLTVCVASWLHFVRREAAAGRALNDPLNDILQKCATRCTGDAQTDLDVFSQLESVFEPDLLGAERFRTSMTRAYESIEQTGDPGLDPHTP